MFTFTEIRIFTCLQDMVARATEENGFLEIVAFAS